MRKMTNQEQTSKVVEELSIVVQLGKHLTSNTASQGFCPLKRVIHG